jgi:hypothetical protein
VEQLNELWEHMDQRRWLCQEETALALPPREEEVGDLERERVQQEEVVRAFGEAWGHQRSVSAPTAISPYLIGLGLRVHRRSAPNAEDLW